MGLINPALQAGSPQRAESAGPGSPQRAESLHALSLTLNRFSLIAKQTITITARAGSRPSNPHQADPTLQTRRPCPAGAWRYWATRAAWNGTAAAWPSTAPRAIAGRLKPPNTRRRKAP